MSDNTLIHSVCFSSLYYDKIDILTPIQIRSAPSLETFKKIEGGYCKVSNFIEIKKINLKIIDLTLLVLL